MYNSQTVVNRIKSIVRSQGRTMTELNENCGIDKSTINMSATKKYGLSALILYDIAEYLKCSVDYLLGRTDTVQTGGGMDLSEREAALIEMYRQLSPEERGYIFGKTETLVELHEKDFQQERA